VRSRAGKAHRNGPAKRALAGEAGTLTAAATCGRARTAAAARGRSRSLSCADGGISRTQRAQQAASSTGKVRQAARSERSSQETRIERSRQHRQGEAFFNLAFADILERGFGKLVLASAGI
jgi:hypothetical protein